MNEKDCYIPQKGNDNREIVVKEAQAHLQQLNEIFDKSRNLPFPQLVQYCSAIRQLHRILEVQLNESKDYQDGLPTSFEDVENEIARCISVCLPDVPQQKTCTSYIRSLLRDYRVVVPVPGQNPTVSLHKVHMIFQDNYADSCFCKLLNILLAEFMNTQTKVIDF